MTLARSPASRPTRSDRDLPPWARLADALTLGALGLAALVYLFDGIRVELSWVTLSARTPTRLLIAAASLAAIRHAGHRARPLPLRLAVAAARVARSPSLAAVWPAFVTTRLMVLLIGYLAVVGLGFRDQIGFRVSADPFWNLPARWDAGWYLGIARRGYDERLSRGQQNLAFFPAFPVLMRVAGEIVTVPARITGRHELFGGGGDARVLWGGVLVSLALFLAALAYVYRLARDHLDRDRAAAAPLLLACYPFAVFYGAPYTESLFLLCITGAFFHMRRGEHAASSLFGFVAGLTRPNGFLLSLPLALIALQRLRSDWPWLARDLRPIGEGRDRRRQVWTGLPASAAPVAGMLTFSLYLYQIVGRAFAWVQAQRGWGRQLGLQSIQDPYNFVGEHGVVAFVSIWPVDVLNAAATVFALALTWPATRRFGLAYGALLAVNLAPPLLSLGFTSMGRYTSVLFPVFLVLAAILPPARRGVWVAGFAMLQGLAAVLFYCWRPLF
jgi:hypothetical protein